MKCLDCLIWRNKRVDLVYHIKSLDSPYVVRNLNKEVTAKQRKIDEILLQEHDALRDTDCPPTSSCILFDRRILGSWNGHSWEF